MTSSRAFTIRPIGPDDAAAIARVQSTSWEETYRGLLPDVVIDRAIGPEGFPKRWRERLASTEPSPVENRVAGLSSDDGRGEVFALYLIGEHHGRGIGRALWDTAVAGLAARDLLPGMVWVLADNSTLDFYRHVGAIEFIRRPCRIPEAKHLVEVGLRFGDGV